jgi:hypothetical protein
MQAAAVPEPEAKAALRSLKGSAFKARSLAAERTLALPHTP